MPEVLLFHGGASGGAPRSTSCRDRGTCANGRVLPNSTCSDRSTCASGGVHHTNSCRDCGTCAGGEVHRARSCHKMDVTSAPGAFADRCCGSRGVEASHSHIAVAAADTSRCHSLTAVAAAETLRRCTRRLLLRQQRPCSVTLCDHCSDSTASAVVVDMSHQLLRRSQHRACVGAHWAHAGQTSLAAAACSNCLR